MNLQANVETITEQTQLFQSIAIILLVITIALFIASIVIFIVFKIPHSFRVLTGIGMNKEISKTNSDNRTRQKATLSWNTSGALNKKAPVENETTILESNETTILSDMDATTVLAGEETTVLVSDETTVLGSDETTVLVSDETTVLNSDETTLLSDMEDSNSLFEMEDDIKITGSNKQI